MSLESESIDKVQLYLIDPHFIPISQKHYFSMNSDSNNQST